MIVIPMAGLSSRFFKAGFELPKYQLMLAGQTVFARALQSFTRYFSSDLFVIIVRDVYDTPTFVREQLEDLGVQNYHICVLPNETDGQAHTVYLGLQQLAKQQPIAPDEPLYIFNIDTFRYDFVKPEQAAQWDGYLEVFRGEGEHWSFIALDNEGRVIRTTEKQRISDLCSDGLYYFKSACRFMALFEYCQANNVTHHGELYIAPMYNLMIAAGETVGYVLIEPHEIDFCGTPAEYEHLLTHGLQQNA